LWPNLIHNTIGRINYENKGSLTFWVGKGMASGKLAGHGTPEKLFAELLGLGLKSGASPNAF
jgi:hypothetical protein